jgi:hypothetical protein
MFHNVKHVSTQYYTLFMNLGLDAPTILSAESNLSLFNDVKTLVKLNVVIHHI